MKNLLVKILFVVVGLVIGSCSQSEIEEQVLKPSVEQVQMEELIQYVEDLKPYVPAPLDVHTRGFWSSFRSWFKNLGKADAGGYRWGRDNGMNFWRGLRVSFPALRWQTRFPRLRGGWRTWNSEAPAGACPSPTPAPLRADSLRAAHAHTFRRHGRHAPG